MKRTLLWFGLAAICLGYFHIDARAAQAQSCHDVAQEDSLLSTLQVVDVRKMRERRTKQMVWRTLGSRIIFLPERDVTPDWVERVARCQLASGRLLNTPAEDDRIDVTVRRHGIYYELRVTSDSWTKANQLHDEVTRRFGKTQS